MDRQERQGVPTQEQVRQGLRPVTATFYQPTRKQTMFNLRNRIQARRNRKAALAAMSDEYQRQRDRLETIDTLTSVPTPVPLKELWVALQRERHVTECRLDSLSFITINGLGA